MKLHEIKNIRWLPQSIYPVVIGYTESTKAMKKAFKYADLSHPSEPVNGRCLELTDKHGDKVIIVHVSKHAQGIRRVSVLTHECVHATQFIAEHIGTVFDVETEAYLTQWIFEHCYHYQTQKR